MIEQLSPIQEHYLKRELVRAQISYEVQHLLDFKSITSLGPPFADSNGEYHDGYRELPIMTHIFNAQVQTFPFINSVNQKEFWQDKVQTFVQSLAQKGLSSSADRSEETKRRRIGRKLTNLIALYMGSGLQTTTPMEKTARVQPPAEKGVRNIDLEKIVLDLYDAHYINDIDVNVVGVRIVSERHGFLYEDHAEFIIKAQFRGAPPVHVARRYSEFRKLQTQLEKEFPGKQLPSLPSHNKTATILSDSEESDSISLASEESDHENESVNRATPLKKFFYGNKKQASTYPREKQRITLRSYLRALLRNSQVVKSQSLLEFFFRDRFKPSLEELKDMDDRRRLDIKRIEDQIEFYKIATERARILEVHMSQFKQDLMAPGGLQNIFSEIREKESIDQLSPKFQKFLEWAEIEVGGTLYNMFVADDSSPELFSQVSRIHKLVPYTLLRAVLRVSNPMAIMKGVIDLFLAQPLGRRSLLQNILIMVLADDIKTQEKAISEMKKKINNPSIVASFEAYINASYSVKEEIRARDSALIVSIVNSPMISQVPPEAVMEIEVWYAEWNRAVEGERIENSEFVDCFSNLTELFKLMVRKRDKDQIQNLWDEASTMGLVKNLFTIFYGPLVEVFRSAKVHEAVGDFEKFMSDLMRVVRAAENNALASDPNQMVQDFYELCQRHVPALFKFIHQVYVHDNGLFDEIMKWISGIMDFLRNGNGKKIDLNKMCQQGEAQAGIDIAKVQRELDSIVSWIDARRKWREKQRAHKKSKNDNTQAIKEWQDALPTNGLDGTAFGLDENDLEEVDDDDDESDLEDEDADADTDSGLTAVEQEQRRRARLLQRLEQQAHAPVRPEITELPKLLRAISCLKGIDVSANGCLTLPEYITRTLGIHCGALSGANLAPEIAEEKFSETTVAYKLPEDFQKGNDVDQEMLFKLFHRPYFHVNVIDDVTGICLAGALKNVVAIAAGFVDGKNWGDNAKAAIMRRGLLEMVRFGSTFFTDCNPKTFTEESAGVADLITSCAGGRNLRIGREFARTGKSLRTLETELLNGQSAQGIITAKEVYEFLSAKNALADFPLLVATYNIAYNGLEVSI